jgi:hypothetical protein
MLEPQPGDTGPRFSEGTDSFNLDKVIRSIENDNGGRLILLDDLHERVHQVEVKNNRGHVTAIKREKDAFQSEITLNPEDSQRFMVMSRR